MADLIALIIFLFSLLGMLMIFLRKVPVLISLPPEVKSPQKHLLFRLKDKTLRIRPFRAFSFEILLQKILSKIRILSLKIESKTANYLQRIREKSRGQKERENDNYWQNLKKSTNQRDNQNKT